MNPYKPTRPLVRFVCAAAALSVTLTIVGLIDALAGHYVVEGQQLAGHASVRMAAR
jgi:hypothetical protein